MALPSEHMGLGDSDEPNPNQSDESIETVKDIMKKFKKWKKHRAKYDRNWLHYYKMFRGDQWDGIKMPRHRQKEIINMVWQAIQSSLPLQTDVRPEFTFIPEEPSDRPFAEVLNKISKADWENNSWLSPLTEIILDGYLYGIGYGEWGYDEDADYGMGSATFNSEDPFYVYPDPETCDINFDDGDPYTRSEGVIIARPVCTERLKKQYPEWKQEIKSDIRDVVASSKTALNDFKIRTSYTDREMPDITQVDAHQTPIPKTLLIKAYLRPFDTVEEEEPEMDENGQVVGHKTIEKKIYPFGRCVTIANGILLEEKDALPFSNNKVPYAKYLNYILPREFFGVSEVEQLESPQRIFNKILNAQLEIMNLMGNPVWITSSDSGVNPHKLVNKTGLVVVKEPGSEVGRVDGVQLSPAALSLIDRTEQWFNNITGTQDVSRGQTPGSVTAASAIEQLTENARTRIRQKQRNLDMFMRQSGQLYLDIILEKYNKMRVFRVTNEEESSEFFKFKTERRLDPETGKEQLVGIVKNYLEREDGNGYIEDEAREFLISGRFDVKINTGSSLPFTKADNETRALNLFDRGIIDEEEVLERIDYPNREKVLERLKQRKEAEAAAAQQQGG